MALAALQLDREKLQAARFAYGFAHAHCRQYPDNKNCSWYHGSWQFLRLLDLVSTPAAHASHYESQLALMAKDPSFEKILVSGSADSGLIQTIHHAFAHRQSEIHATVVDICATPLKICAQYGETAELNITTLEQDVLEGLPAGAYDAIFTHSFMGYFDDADRQCLLHQWANALRKGGRLITVQRIRENYPNDIVRFDSREVEAFVARAAELMQQHGTDELAEYDIVDMARRFAENFRNFPVRSAEQLKAMFETAGFNLTLFKQQETKGTPGVTGPSVPNAAGFYLIVAERA